MSPEELESELAAGTLRPAYLVAGEETVSAFDLTEERDAAESIIKLTGSTSA